jgi:hypothetical protein
MSDFGRLYDCGDSRDGTGYKDITDSQDPEMIAAQKRMLEILADKPALDVKAGRPAGKGGAEKIRKKRAS